jgi:hypothetical protein
MSERSGDPFYLVYDKFFSLLVCNEMNPDLYFQSGAISMQNYAYSDPNPKHWTKHKTILLVPVQMGSYGRYQYLDKRTIFFAEFGR